MTTITTLHPQYPAEAQPELDELHGRWMAAVNAVNAGYDGENAPLIQDDPAENAAWDAYQAAKRKWNIRPLSLWTAANGE